MMSYLDDRENRKKWMLVKVFEACVWETKNKMIFDLPIIMMILHRKFSRHHDDLMAIFNHQMVPFDREI